MPSPVGAVFTLVARALPLLVKYGPKALAAMTVLTKFINDNPAVPAWFRTRLGDVPQRLSDNQKQHGEAAKIRGTLDIIRDVAKDAQAADERVDAAGYATRADRIERGVRLAETQERAARKARLGTLKADTDALLTDVLDAVTTAAPSAPSGGTDRVEDEPHSE